MKEIRPITYRVARVAQWKCPDCGKIGNDRIEEQNDYQVMCGCGEIFDLHAKVGFIDGLREIKPGDKEW